MAKVTATTKWGTTKPAPPAMRNMDPWTVTLRYKN